MTNTKLSKSSKKPSCLIPAVRHPYGPRGGEFQGCRYETVDWVMHAYLWHNLNPAPWPQISTDLQIEVIDD
jgi:hypothetical protein